MNPFPFVLEELLRPGHSNAKYYRMEACSLWLLPICSYYNPGNGLCQRNFPPLFCALSTKGKTFPGMIALFLLSFRHNIFMKLGIIFQLLGRFAQIPLDF